MVVVEPPSVGALTDDLKKFVLVLSSISICKDFMA